MYTRSSRLHQLDPTVSQFLIHERLDAVGTARRKRGNDFGPFVAQTDVLAARPEGDVARPTPEDESGAVRQSDNDVLKLRIPTICVRQGREFSGRGVAH